MLIHGLSLSLSLIVSLCTCFSCDTEYLIMYLVYKCCFIVLSGMWQLYMYVNFESLLKVY